MIKKIKKVNLLKNGIYVNDIEVFPFTKEQNTADTLKEIYRHLKIDYPKFFKMDNLSKLGFLSAEMLLENIDNKEDVGIVLSTSSSSLETDTAFQKTIKDADNFFPSPSVFVYTLPNIVIGEICIRHKIYGENMMFIIKENELAHFYHQTEKIIQEIGVKQGIIGYLECYNNNFKAEFILVENQ
jgi:predicted DNA-binding transcriptional regulator